MRLFLLSAVIIAGGIWLARNAPDSTLEWDIGVALRTPVDEADAETCALLDDSDARVRMYINRYLQLASDAVHVRTARLLVKCRKMR